MPYELPANPTTLLDIRKMVVSYSGDNSLVKTVLADEWVDNGVDHYINMGMKFLERNYYTPLGNRRDFYGITQGTYYHSIPRIKVLRSVWFINSDGDKTRLDRKDLLEFREDHPGAFSDEDEGDPREYAVAVPDENRVDLGEVTELVPLNTVLWPAFTPGWSVGGGQWTVLGSYWQEIANGAMTGLHLHLALSGTFNISITFATMTEAHYITVAQYAPVTVIMLGAIVDAAGTYNYTVTTNDTVDSIIISPTSLAPDRACTITDFSVEHVAELTEQTRGQYLWVLPPPDADGTIEVFGDFFSSPLSAATDYNWWILNAPTVLVYASLYQREVSRRQVDAANEWLKAMLIELQSLRMDANENFGPEPGELRMEIV